MLLFVALVLLLFVAGGAALSYYVEALWFGSLGYGDIFWKTVNVKAAWLRCLRSMAASAH
jgi:uncharacterized protein